jgi:G protein-coupled receptor GPR1
MLRSLLEIIYGVVAIIKENGDTAIFISPVVLASGWIMAYSLEASDAMVFIIAVHTAVYVFRPKLRSPKDEGGLWRWRAPLFAAWILIPAILASLAFIHYPAYIPLVTWCYLPPRPLVWRYALAWGPRYFIFLTITVIYVALYIHVRLVYRRISRSQAGSIARPSASALSRPISGHSRFRGRKRDNAFDRVLRRLFLCKGRKQTAPTESFNQTFRHPFPEVKGKDEPCPTERTAVDSDVEKTAENSVSSQDSLSPTGMCYGRRGTNTGQSILSNNSNTPDFIDDTRRVSLVLHMVASNAPYGFADRRARVERQIRSLFIFPVVYFLMWIPPFINHIYQSITYENVEDENGLLPAGIFTVGLIASVFLPLQGFINVFVYAIREKPWKKSATSPPSASHSSRPSIVNHLVCPPNENLDMPGGLKPVHLRPVAETAFESSPELRPTSRRLTNWWDADEQIIAPQKRSI